MVLDESSLFPEWVLANDYEDIVTHLSLRQELRKFVASITSGLMSKSNDELNQGVGD